MMLKNWCSWLFTEEERRPISFIETFFLIVIMSAGMSLFMMSIARHLMY